MTITRWWEGPTEETTLLQVLILHTTNAKHTFPSYHSLNGGKIVEPTTNLPPSTGNPIVSGAVVLIIQQDRSTLNTEWRQCGSVQYVRFPCAKDRDTMSRAVFFCFMKRRHCFTHVVLKHKAGNCRSAYDVLRHPVVPIMCLLCWQNFHIRKTSKHLLISTWISGRLCTTPNTQWRTRQTNFPPMEEQMRLV